MFINGTMMQFFHWFYPANGLLWDHLAAEAPTLASAGITALWLPPAYKGAGAGGNNGATDVGYGTYDLFDLGEFNQKNTVRTRWGTRRRFLDAVVAAKVAGLQVYEDVVFNHKHGADGTEEVGAVAVDWENRNNPPPGQGSVERIEIWSKFDFPGRGNQYSSLKWRARHFDAADWDERGQRKALWRLKEKHFDTPVDPEKGNYDYLMSCDLDMDSQEVRDELKYWGQWIVEMANIDGFRIDAAKHIRFFFFNEWLDHVRSVTGRGLFAVAEYYDTSLGDLRRFLDVTERRMSLFDFPLQEKFHFASRHSGQFPMRHILDGTLMQSEPEKAVTFIENHDTQAGRNDPKPVEPWFKPLAYALILLRSQGYPCIFYPDYYGASYTGFDNRPVTLYSHRFLIDQFLVARRGHAYGPQKDYFDHDNIIGWTRLGDAQHPTAMAVVMSDGPGGTKWMDVGRPSGRFRDLTGHVDGVVECNSDGWGEFSCPGGSVSVWIPQ
jgi:alpha-amylase